MHFASFARLQYDADLSSLCRTDQVVVDRAACEQAAGCNAVLADIAIRKHNHREFFIDRLFGFNAYSV